MYVYICPEGRGKKYSEKLNVICCKYKSLDKTFEQDKQNIWLEMEIYLNQEKFINIQFIREAAKKKFLH